MGGGYFHHQFRIAGACIALAASVSFGLPSAARAQTAVVSGNCPYWIDAKTGERVPTTTIPAGTSVANYRNLVNGPDKNHVSQGGANFVRQPDGSWTDAATGQQVPTTVLPAGTSVSNYRNLVNGPDKNHVSQGGTNFVLIPCPPAQTAVSTGLYIGGELVKNWGWARSTERSAANDVVTNQFTDRADPIGGGFLIGYRFAPFNNSIMVSPFASFDFMRAPVNHTFANGSFLGTTANFMGTLGVKVGPQFDAFWLYGIGGFSVLNETLNINFIPVASSQSATVPGGTLGIGGAWRPNFLQGFGLPVSVFAEYQHFWWADASFNTPAASPAFNYTFRRQDDLVKVGFTVDLSPPPPPLRVTLPTK